MIGTNDLLSDGNNSILGDRIDTVTKDLLDDMDTIVNRMFTANKDADVIVMPSPAGHSMEMPIPMLPTQPWKLIIPP